MGHFFRKNGNKIERKVYVKGLTANGTIVLPAGAVVQAVYYSNVTANAVTGGIKIGTSNGGTEVVAAMAVGASKKGREYSIVLKDAVVVDTTLYIQAVTAWNSANVDLVVEYIELSTAL